MVDVFSGKVVDPAADVDPLAAELLRQVRTVLQRQALHAIGALDLSTLLAVTTRQSAAAISIATADAHKPGRIVDKKYIPDLYVPRAELERAFTSFLASDQQVFAVVGDAGMGKTNSLCHLVEYLSRSRIPVLLYHGTLIGRSVSEAVCKDFEEVLAGRTFREIVHILSAAVETEHLTAFVVIDALNEFSGDRQALRTDLNEVVREISGSRIRLIVSCRSLDWDFWTRNENQMLGYLGRAIYQEAAAGNMVKTAVTLEALSDAEFLEAWRKYKAAFRLSGSLSGRMERLCREPFMLRLVAESYRDGKAIPGFVEPLELFQKYFEEKFPSESTQMPARRFLLWMARRILATGVPRVRIDDIAEGDMGWCRRLLDENVIIWRTESHLFFHFELFLEFIVAKVVLQDLGEKPTVDGKLAFLKRLTVHPLINTPGVVENVLLLWQSQSLLLARALEHLLSLEDRWKAIACSTIRKLERPSQEVRPVLASLARDDNPFIRLFAAQAAQSYVAQHGWRDVLDLAGDGEPWEGRETAANIVGRGATIDPTVTRLVWRLADDYHWRVRRAAGYALHRLWSQKQVPASEKQAILDSIGTSSWRQRYALGIALLGMDLSGRSRDNRILSALARDPNPQVRWGVANYLPRYQGHAIYKLVDLLSKDGDPWVRAKVVESLVRLAATNWTAVRPRLELLTHDAAPMVRVKLARELTRLADRAWIERQLRPYLADLPDVKFAAAYTLETVRPDEAAIFPVKVDAQSQLRILRERVARRDLNPTTARFAPVREYITRRTELSAVDDAYMTIIDTMCSLIITTSDSIRGARLPKQAFLMLLSEDLDEAVRWALVLFVVKYGAKYLRPKDRLEVLRKMASDEHWWVRREVAIALGHFVHASNTQRSAHHILKALERSEQSRADVCKDEVLHFVRLAMNRAPNREEATRSRASGTRGRRFSL